MTVGQVQYYQPLIKQEINKPEYKITVSNIDYAAALAAGEEASIKISLENTGDFDLENVNLKMSVYDLEIYESTKLDLKKGKSVTKTFNVDIPENAASGYYDLKITLNSDKISRVLYREIFVT